MPRVTLRLVVALLVAAVALLGVAGPATAQDGDVDVDPNENGGWTPNGETPGGETGGDDGGGGGTVFDVEVDYDVDFNTEGDGVGNEEGYEGCWEVTTVAEGTGDDLADAIADRDGLGENGVAYGNCDLADTIPPEVIARIAWERLVVPPPPTPLAVDPGKALTGLTAYLEIGGDNPATATVNTPLGVATFTMTPRYVVSWGDGASTTTTSQGGPYPNGDVTHVYVDPVPVVIDVDAYWSATWTLAGSSGSLPEHPVSTNATLDLPVEQRQAVID